MDKHVLHISTGKNGGAAKSAFLLHNELLNLGISSSLLTVAEIDQNDAFVYSLASSPLKKNCCLS